ncbi:MAG: hypothetical protein ACOVQ7_10060 [Limnoraphis robusta]
MNTDIFSSYFSTLATTDKLPQPSEKESCPHRGSTNLVTTDGVPPHAGQIRCEDCDSFIKWIPSQKTLDRHQDYRQRLDRLLKLPLKGWSGTFIRDLDKQWRIANRDGKTLKLSPKQADHLARIEGGDR